jgi:hypothetical protein
MSPSACLRPVISTSQPKFFARSFPVITPSIQRLQTLACTHCQTFRASLPLAVQRATNTATMATTRSITLMTGPAPSIRATLLMDPCTLGHSRVLTSHTTKKRPIVAFALDRVRSRAARITPLHRGAAHDMRNRLQNPVVWTDSCTGRFVGYLILYSGLAFVLREEVHSS